MKKHLGISIMLAALASTPALAGDAVLGALIGGGAGAVVGSSIGGRDAALIGGALGAATGAAIASSHGGTRVYVAPPAYMPPPPPAVYVPAPVIYPQQAYYAPPVRVERRVYYVENGYGYPRGAYGRYERRHHHDYHDRGWRDDDRRRGWDGR